MRRSDGMAEKQAKFKNVAPRESKSKENRSANRISNIASLDNGTMVEVYKYLNYCGLANNSLVSKRFRNVIQTHRNKLALLYVDSIVMELRNYQIDPTEIKVFDERLSSEEYTEWIVRNDYLKQVLLEDQVAGKEYIYDDDRKVYQLEALAYYKEPIRRRTNNRISVFSARTELNREGWPLFQHFVCLLADPFVYIRRMELTTQNDVFSLLTGAINPDRSRIQCRELTFRLESSGNAQKFFSWIKNQMCCDGLRICNDRSQNVRSNCDEELIDLLVTGAPCTSLIVINGFDLSNFLVAVVQKFIDLKTCDENKIIESIRSDDPYLVLVEVLKRNFANFFLEEKQNDTIGLPNNVVCMDNIFQFANNNVGKKLHLVVTTAHYGTFVSLDISNL